MEFDMEMPTSYMGQDFTCQNMKLFTHYWEKILFQIFTYTRYNTFLGIETFMIPESTGINTREPMTYPLNL